MVAPGRSSAKLSCVAPCQVSYIKKSQGTAQGFSPFVKKKLSEKGKKDGMIEPCNKILRDALIPGKIEEDGFSKTFDIKNFDLFAESRSKLILNRILEIIGTSLKNEELLENED
jgi:hypothetical protein